MSLFSLGSRLPGESCDIFLLSELRCIFFALPDQCQQISIWNKQIESSINLIKQHGDFLKSDDQRDHTFNKQGTQKIKILIEDNGTRLFIS